MNQPETTIDFLLDVARDAIRQRAARDHDNPESYNAEEDPEGFVTSILIALQHWCHRHGLEWELELSRAEECFTQDLDDAGEDTRTKRCPSIAELQCPECQHTGHFFIQATESLLIYADGEQLEGDEGPQWGRTSSCACPECGHLGVVFQFHNPKKKE